MLSLNIRQGDNSLEASSKILPAFPAHSAPAATPQGQRHKISSYYNCEKNIKLLQIYHFHMHAGNWSKVRGMFLL